MKSLILITFIMMSLALNQEECLQQHCTQQLTECHKDKICKLERHFQLTDTKNIHSMKLEECKKTNCLYYSPNVTCPNSCLDPTNKGYSYCKGQETVVQYECIVEYLQSQGYTDCADKQCVCSESITLGLFVGGCRC